MNITASALISLAVIFFAGCQHASPADLLPGSVAGESRNTITPSPRLIVGRVIAVDQERGFAFVELTGDAPAQASAANTELSSRTADLKGTALLQASQHRLGRTLGARITSGNPAPGDEVVMLAP